MTLGVTASWRLGYDEPTVTPTDPLEPQILARDGTLSLIAVRNVLFAVWREAPTLRHLEKLFEQTQATRSQWPKGGALVDLILTGTPRFSNEVRKEAVRQFRAEPRDLCSAHVILLRGLSGVAVRAFFNGVIMLARPVAPAGVFSSQDEAAKWMMPHMARGTPSWTCSELQRAMTNAVRAG